MTKVILVGNPNCGKTTLFNALTGDTQRIGNWPGVTVEKKTGSYTLDGAIFTVTDLPGVYSLTTTRETAKDAQITAQEVVCADVDVIINVIDACHLERHLYLTTQLLELGKPLVIALNMSDIAKQRGISIDTNELANQLQCKVISTQGNRKIGLDELRHAIATMHQDDIAANPGYKMTFPEVVQKKLNQLERESDVSPYQARRLLEALYQGDVCDPESLDILMADARYAQIHKLVLTVQKKHSDATEDFTAKLDRVVLHRIWGLPIFFWMMYLVFLLAMNVGGMLQRLFDITTNTLFVERTATFLRSMNLPDWVIGVCANGIGQGISTTLTFIPVIAAMYFLLSLLETSGYMARAAFVIDKIMRLLKLPGKSFVPMMVGFGCNVPGIMATRTLENERDRILTVLMSPFMSCSARLTIYAVFVAAFFPEGGQNIVFLLYLIGIGMAVLTGCLLRKSILRGPASPLILELPAYHRPSLQRLLKETSLRTRYFIVRAGKLIVPICALLGGLNQITVHGGQLSVLAYIGQWITPIFSPMGIQSDNWPAVVGLLTGTLAKEVVIGTLNGLYAQIGNTLTDPMLAAHQISTPIVGMISQHFHNKVEVFSYLLFILLYIPCISTMAAIRQETNKKLMWFSVSWSLLVAYTSAVLFYQIATCTAHIQQTLIWTTLLMVIVYLAVILIRRGGQHAITTA